MKTQPLIVTLVLTALILLGVMILKNSSVELQEVPPEPSERPVPGEDVSKSRPTSITHPPREFEPDWGSLNAYQNTITKQDFQRLIVDVYTIGDDWKEVISIGDEEATIKTGDGYFELKFLAEGGEPPHSLKRYWSTGPLQGLHIAIDPGHIGGDFAIIEERHFGYPADKPVREGEMSLITAQRLKPMLEKMGAKVSLVRSKNEPVTTKRVGDALRLYQQFNPGVPDGLLKSHATRLFYRRAEIEARADLVNNVLKPDLVLCLHYNASGDSDVWADNTKPVMVEENHYHMILNGGYGRAEVLDEVERFQMIERILQRTHEREASMAKVVAEVFVEHTGLPPFLYQPDSSKAKMVDGNEYLWARNLLANRAFTCPVLYFEPWVMNHAEVYARAQAGDYDGLKMVAGKERPSIMMEYATAVADGIKEFYSEKTE